MSGFMQIISLVTIFVSLSSHVNSEITTSMSGQDDLLDLLHTEKVLIDALRSYIETQEKSLSNLKRKTHEIQESFDRVGADREKYINNPINSIITLKRFTSQWNDLHSEADDHLNTEELIANFTQQKQQLSFPTEDDYDSALGNLLIIQDMFQLEPQRLAIGEVSGVKLGSEMSWSDCLEIGLKSLKKGYQTYAKFWMETALEKLPSVINAPKNANTTDEQQTPIEGKVPTPAIVRDEYSVKARQEVLKALLNVEYKTGNLDKALKIAYDMLELNPKQKSVLKAINQIKEDKKKIQFGHKKAEAAAKQPVNAIRKSDEELMIEEMCREATNNQQHHLHHSHSHSQPSMASVSPHQSHCVLTTHNLKWLLLQPLQVELLNLDPFIVIYHNVLSDTQSKELKEFVVESNDEDVSLQLTKIGNKKMHKINEKLHYATGYDLSAHQWQIKRYNFENLMKVESSAVRNVKDTKRQAGVLFNMQQPLLGGAVIFPQLELSVSLPQRAILQWSMLNEFNVEDYRTKFHICPVIGGTQISATTYAKL